MSVNKVILVGNVGKDPEVRYFDDQNAVASFSLATNEVSRDREGNRIKITEWHNIRMRGELAKLAEKFVKKGSQIYIEGKIKTETWEDKATGQPKSAIVIMANVMNFLGGGTSSNSGTGENSSNKPMDSSPTFNNDKTNNQDSTITDDLPF